MNLSKLKIAIIHAYRIAEWNPTTNDLEAIAKKLSEAIEQAPDMPLSQFHAIIAPQLESATFMCLEGEDNSDLITLLQLAKNAK